MTNLAHSPLGPSSADRWLNCPGSVILTKDIQEIPSRYAAEGTAAHAVAQEAQTSGDHPQTFLGNIIEVGEFQIQVDQEMVDGVRFFLDHMNDLPPGVDFNESKVHYNRWVPGGFGTLDRARASGNTVYIRDLKYGKGIQVYARDNSQLKLYAAGFLEEFGWMLDDIEMFDLGIVQPRLDHVDSWQISKADLLKWMDEVVVPGAKATIDVKSAPIKAGSWCQFCKIKSTCMVRASAVMAEVVSDFDNLDAAVIQTTVVGPNPVVNMGNVQIAKALAALSNIRAWCKDLETHAMRELQRGEDMGGWKLVEGRSNRALGLDEKAFIAEAVEQGVTDLKVLYTDPKLKTPAALETVLGKKHPLLKKEGVVIKPKGKPKLAPPGDGRAAMKLDGTEDFEALGDD